MVYFLALSMFFAIVIAVHKPSSDYGMSVVFATAAMLCAMFLHDGMDPNVESYYIFPAEFFAKLTQFFIWVSFFFLFWLGFKISFYQAKLKEQVRQLKAKVGAYEDSRPHVNSKMTE